MHQEISGVSSLPVEEVKITEEFYANGKKRRRKRNMEKYAPLIFEECYVKHKRLQKVKNTFELQSEVLQEKVLPNLPKSDYNGSHVFVMCHGFQGSSFDMRNFKNIISIALPDSLFLCSAANEQDTEGSILDMGYKLA